MKLEEVWAKIALESKMTEGNLSSIIKWSLENKVDETNGKTW